MQKQYLKSYVKIFVIFIILFCSIFSYEKIFASSIDTTKLGQLLNQERASRGLGELCWNEKLYEAAIAKANHMIANNYFNHYAPDGTTPWQFIQDSGYVYKIAGENLAMDFVTAKAVHDAWMASSSHKNNMLNEKYKDYAICAVDGVIDNNQTTLIVEMFGSAQTDNNKINYFLNNIAQLLLGKTKIISH